ncbi:MAG TPA: anthranilate synthase component I family protein [Acidimicrobiales bacterium]|nr:anthranilate synthase component I family protein [Acidimicrobiales bacterium]
MPPLERDEFAALARAGHTLIPLTRTLQLDRETPVSLYQRFSGGRAIFLLESAALGEETGRYSFIGLDRRWRVTTRGAETVVEGAEHPGGDQPLAVLRALLARYRAPATPDLPDLVAGAVGFVAYDYVRRLERLPRESDPDPWPDVDFSFPGAVLVVDHLRHSTTVAVGAEVDGDPDAAFDGATARLDGIVDTLLAEPPARDPAVERLVAGAPESRSGVDVRAMCAGLSNFTPDAYAEVVARAKEHIRAGDVFQVVPSQQFCRPTTVDPLTLYRVLRALNPSPYMYLLDSGDTQIVGASPEMLVRVAGRTVSTRPIAGTRPRGATPAEDAALEAAMRGDDKELAEHVMLVDLGRNDVGRVAVPGSVDVAGLAHVERFSHLMHLVSRVDGTLRDGLDAFDAFDALFPAGTLTGAPKVRAMELIDTFETVARGPYGGAVGYVALNGNADFAITIRTLALRGGVATGQAGGGVVADSVAESEYLECLNKATAPLLALHIADPL